MLKLIMDKIMQMRLKKNNLLVVAETSFGLHLQALSKGSPLLLVRIIYV